MRVPVRQSNRPCKVPRALGPTGNRFAMVDGLRVKSGFRQKPVSCPLWVVICRHGHTGGAGPLCPQNRTLGSAASKSARGQKQTHALQQAGLFDHLVGSQQYGGGHRSNVDGSASGAPQDVAGDNSPRPALIGRHTNQIGVASGHLRLRPSCVPLHMLHCVSNFRFKFLNSIWLPKAGNLRVVRCD